VHRLLATWLLQPIWRHNRHRLECMSEMKTLEMVPLIRFTINRKLMLPRIHAKAFHSLSLNSLSFDTHYIASQSKNNPSIKLATRITLQNLCGCPISIMIRVGSRLGRLTGVYSLVWPDLTCLVDRPRLRLFRKPI